MYEVSEALQSQLQMSAQEIEELRDAFSLFDPQSKGKISYDDFESLTSSIGLRVQTSRDQTDGRLSHCNTDTEEIDFAQFLKMTIVPTRSRNNSYQVESELREAFSAFDKDNKGFLSASDLKQVLLSLGDNSVTDDDVFEMMKEADLDKDDHLNYEEFRSMMCRTMSDYS